MKKSNLKSTLQKLHKEAIRARKNAYSPYSNYKVGAALLTEKGFIFSGCNVENASYGGTICAERSAVFSAISSQGKLTIKEICVVTNSKQPWPPCGFCRQVLQEFADKNTRIYLANEKKVTSSYTMAELLPEAFGPKNLL